MSDRNKVLLALAVSALLHVLGVLGLITWASLRSNARSTPPAEFRQIVMTVAPLPKEPPAKVMAQATPPPSTAELDSAGLAKADKPPEQPLFESDIDSRAATQSPATGLTPLPGQEGKERPFPEFETKKYSLGPIQQPPEMVMPPAPAEPAAAASQTNPEKQAAKETEKQAAAEATPKPAIPKPTPTPIASSTPKEDTLAVTASPTPEPSATPTPAESPNDEIPKPTPVMHSPKVQELAMLSNPAPRQPRPRRPSYQPETEETRIESSISNLGSKPGADMLSTPLGRYRKTIADAIGSRWYFYINQKMDLITVGSVRIKFYIDEQGHAEDIKILSNSANGAFGDFSVQSISEAELPPLPPDLAPKLENGRLEVDYTFTIYPN